MRLASMEKAGHVVRGGILILLSTQNGRHKFGNFRCVLFFVHHVETGNQARILFFANANVVKNFGNMRVTDHLIANQNEHQMEIWVCSAHICQNVVDHFEFIQKWHLLLFVIKQTPGCVSKFENENVLL